MLERNPAPPATTAAAGPPTRAEAEAAVATLLRWTGDDPGREGLRDTPARVARAYEEMFAGYAQDPVAILDRIFTETGDYDGPVLVRDIPFASHCEHHVLPFVGVAHVAYWPRGGIVGLSKIARLVEALSRRLQTQERLTSEIVAAMETALRPHGVAVVIEAEHFCMSMRGIAKPGATTVTSRVSGRFATDPEARSDILAMIRPRR